MKKAFLFLALCLLGAGRAAAAEPVDSVRNVIYMIGDGMGLAHVSMLAVEGGYAPTAFDRAQGIALISTYSANNRVTDSAAAGTALACGSKTNNGTLGLDPRGGRLQSVIEWAVAEGMPAGIAVKCHLQHATPAAFYAHVPDRGDEKAITRDLLASNIDVLIGAGRRLEKESSEGGSYRDAFGRRGYAVAGSLEEAEPVRAGRLLCAVTDENIPKTIRREDYLRCATQKALEILSHNADSVGRGFVLMVEGSLIDGASHGNDAEKILAEMRDFERAVAAAMDFADRTPGTLVVVTADHETGGSPSRAATVILPAPRAVSDMFSDPKATHGDLRPRLPLWYGCGAYCWDNGQHATCPAGHGAAREGVAIFVQRVRCGPTGRSCHCPVNGGRELRPACTGDAVSENCCAARRQTAPVPPRIKYKRRPLNSGWTPFAAYGWCDASESLLFWVP